jgi:hypothetical protein
VFYGTLRQVKAKGFGGFGVLEGFGVWKGFEMVQEVQGVQGVKEVRRKEACQSRLSSTNRPIDE